MQRLAPAAVIGLLLLSALLTPSALGQSTSPGAPRIALAPTSGASKLLSSIPPYPESQSAQASLPFPTIGSWYLHMAERAAVSSATPDQIARFYAHTFAAQGMRVTSRGYSGTVGSPVITDRMWGFQRNPLSNLTVYLYTRSRGPTTLYGLAVELVLVPARPRGSLAPDDLRYALVLLQGGVPPAQPVRVTGSALRKLARRFDQLPLISGVTHGPCWNPGSAVVTFVGARRTLTAEETCSIVRIAGQPDLQDVLPHGFMAELTSLARGAHR